MTGSDSPDVGSLAEIQRKALRGETTGRRLLAQ